MAAIAVLTSAILQISFALTAKTPSFPFDELTLLQYSKYFSGTGMNLPVSGPGYFPGWAIVMAPLWWITSDPLTMYHYAIGLGVLIGVATIWPLSHVIERLKLRRPQAIAVAGIVMCMPSRVVQAGYAMSEKLLCLLIVCTALAAYRLWEETTYRRAAMFGILVSLTVLTHARAIVVLPISVAWLLIFFRRDRRLAIISSCATALLGASAFALSIEVNQHLLQFQFTQGYSVAGNLFSGASIILRTFLGQSWYQIVSSLGIVVVGLVAMVRWVASDWRSNKQIGAHAWMLTVSVGAFMLSVLAWSNSDGLFPQTGRGRLDAAIYGRYGDPFTMLLVAAGLAAIVRGLRYAPLIWSLCVNGVILAATVLWVAPNAHTWGIVTPAHIPGILPWGSSLPYPQSLEPGWLPSVYQKYGTWSWMMPSWTNRNRFWLHASSATLVFLVLLCIAVICVNRLRRHAQSGSDVPSRSSAPEASNPLETPSKGLSRSRLLHSAMAKTLCVMLILACCAGSYAAIPMVRNFQLKDGGKPSVVQSIQDIDRRYGTMSVAFDTSCTPHRGSKGWAMNAFSFWLQSDDFSLTSHPRRTKAQLLISCSDFKETTHMDVKAVSGANSIGYQLWVLPGDQQSLLSELE
ncbi:ArnT family glycosyltransferase [Bifidobacterium sp.]|uniref:ArnT family glycosyltransferase n=1 Tax=Bifidobacterium sp. TaxID=41200 RepID=UPI0039EC9597